MADAVGDLISDFSHDEGDKIEFRHIDADIHTAGEQKLTFSGMTAQGHSVWYVVDHKRNSLSLLGDTDGDARTHEMDIKLNEMSILHESDILIF